MDKQIPIESVPIAQPIEQVPVPSIEPVQGIPSQSPTTEELIIQAEISDKSEIEKVRSEIRVITDQEADSVAGEEADEALAEEQEISMLEPGFTTPEAQFAFYKFMETSKVYRQGEKEAKEFTEALDEVMNRQFEMSLSRQLSVIGTLVKIILNHMASKTFDSTFGIVKDTVIASGSFEINSGVN